MDSGEIRARLSIAEEAIDTENELDREIVKVNALFAIGHALVNISDDLSRILDVLGSER